MNGFYAVGSREDIQEIQKTVSDLDVVTTTAEPVKREFVQIEYGDLEEFRELFETLVPDTRITVDNSQSTLILEGSPCAIEQAKELLAQLDKPLDQIVLECKLVRARQSLKIDWGKTALRTSPENARVRVGTFKRATLATSQLVPFQSPDKSTLASPRIALQSGQHGNIHVGDKLPGKTQDVGLTLETTATLDEKDQTIHCKIHGQFTVPGNPIVTFEGDLDVQDGETAVLEGLLSPELARQAVEVTPALAELPIIGQLFRDIEDEDRLYLMLTPNVMK